MFVGRQTVQQGTELRFVLTRMPNANNLSIHSMVKSIVKAVLRYRRMFSYVSG